MKHHARPLAALVLALGVVLAAGGTAEAKEKKKKVSLAEAQALVDENTREFVGKVDGTDAYISIVEVNGNVEIYICDGAGIITWPAGTVKDGKLSAKSPNGVVVAGTLDDSGSSGTVTLADGTAHAFTAEPAVSPAGLYWHRPSEDAAGNSLRAATIQLPDGSERGGTSPTSVEACKAIANAALGYAGRLTFVPSTTPGSGPTIYGNANDVANWFNFRNLFSSQGCIRQLGSAALSPV